jgi:neutral trehalase
MGQSNRNMKIKVKDQISWMVPKAFKNFTVENKLTKIKNFSIHQIFIWSGKNESINSNELSVLFFNQEWKLLTCFKERKNFFFIFKRLIPEACVAFVDGHFLNVRKTKKPFDFIQANFRK